MVPVLQKQRARSTSDKEVRRGAILASARRLLDGNDWSELRIEAVARGAGVAKASVFRYFATKEELVLDVYLGEVAGLFSTLADVLSKSGGDAGGGRAALARALGQALGARPLFVRLSAAVHAVLERRITVASARRFKLALRDELAAAGVLLETRLALAPGRGLPLLLRFHAVVIGLWQLADHPPAVAQAIAGGGLDAFRIDFAAEVERMFLALLRDQESSP
jgi:AcrR family transcriptional regulator